MDDRANLVLAECGRTVGSSQRVIWELATRLPPARFLIQAWLPAAPVMDDLAEALENREVEVARMPDVDSRWDFRGLVRLWLRVRRMRPTLLHLHRAGSSADRLSAILAEAAGQTRIVVTEHAGAEQRSVAHRSLRRRVLERADAVTVVCGEVADALVRDEAMDRARIHVIANGAEIPDESAETVPARNLRSALGAGPLRPLWVCPGRLASEKGHAVLFESLAELRRRGLSFTVALSGEGPLREELSLRARDLGLSESIHFMELGEDLGPWLFAADSVIMPSLREASPLLLMEALARGRPVVASAVGGVPEVIEDGVSGRLVPPGDAMALAQALDSIHRKPDASLRMGDRAAHRVREQFTWGHVVDAFEEVYDDVLGLATFEPAGASAAAARR